MNSAKTNTQLENEKRVPLTKKTLFSVCWGLLFMSMMYFFMLLKALFIDTGLGFAEAGECLMSDCLGYRQLIERFLVHWIMASSIFLFGWIASERKAEV